MPLLFSMIIAPNCVDELFVELFSKGRYFEKASGKPHYTKTTDFGICDSRGSKVLVKN